MVGVLFVLFRGCAAAIRGCSSSGLCLPHPARILAAGYCLFSRNLGFSTSDCHLVRFRWIHFFAAGQLGLAIPAFNRFRQVWPSTIGANDFIGAFGVHLNFCRYNFSQYSINLCSDSLVRNPWNRICTSFPGRRAAWLLSFDCRCALE